jgi:hypothetical protein
LTLETVYFIAQTVAALAVIASIIFLGMQVRENTREQKLRREHELQQMSVGFFDHFTDDEANAEVFIRGGYDYRGLSGPQKFRFNNLASKAVRNFEYMLALNRAGVLDDPTLERQEQMIYSLLGMPGARVWWERSGMGEWFPPETRARITALIENGASRGFVATPDMRDQLEDKHDA